MIRLTSEQALPSGMNWAGNVAFSTPRIASTSSLDDLVHLVRTAPRMCNDRSWRAHFALADSYDLTHSVEGLAAIVIVHDERGTVPVQTGTPIDGATQQLDDAACALGTIATLRYISAAGAIATETAGSGDSTGLLADAVVALDIVRAERLLVPVHDSLDDFDGAVMALGPLGVVTRVEFAVELRQPMIQVVDRWVPWDSALADLNEVFGPGEGVSLFTTWAEVKLIDQVRRKSRGEAPGRTPQSVAHYGIAASSRDRIHREHHKSVWRAGTVVRVIRPYPR